MVRRVSVDGTISAVAGIGYPGYKGDGGPALNARLNMPRGCAVDSVGDIFIADSANNAIRVVTPDGDISTIAGNGNAGFSGDGGPAAQALLQTPYGVAVDPQGNVYVADTGNNRIRRLTPSVPLLGELTQTLGFANAASLISGPVVAGSIISIFGSGLGPLVGVAGTLQSRPCWQRNWLRRRSCSIPPRRLFSMHRTARLMRRCRSRRLGTRL